MAKVSKISDFTIVHYYDHEQWLMYARNGVVRSIEGQYVDWLGLFGEDECQETWDYNENPSYEWVKVETVEKLSECTPEQLLLIIDSTPECDICVCTDEWEQEQEEVRKAAQKQFLSSLMQKAWAKVKSGVQRTIQTALCSVWSEHKITKSGQVSFVKIDTDEITTRRVGKLSDHGYVPKTSTPTKTPKGDIFKFVDLDKLALTGSVYTSIISFHAWQVW